MEDFTLTQPATPAAPAVQQHMADIKLENPEAVAPVAQAPQAILAEIPVAKAAPKRSPRTLTLPKEDEPS